MNVLKIKIKDGYFVGTEGPYLNKFTATYVNGNGWECRFDEEGNLVCTCVKKLWDEIHSMRYIVYTNGFAKLTLKKPNRGVHTIRKGYVVPKGACLSEGFVGLSDGYIDERYAYFRDKAIQDFMDKYGIKAIKNIDPNTTYQVRKANYPGEFTDTKVYSDGKRFEIGYDSGRTTQWEHEYPNEDFYEEEYKVEISDATWVIYKHVESFDDEPVRVSSVLYTMDNIEYLNIYN